jgi:hypothetical protein
MRSGKDSIGKVGQPARGKKSIPGDRKEKRSEIDPVLKSFVDNCIVPILVKQYTDTAARERVREIKRPKPYSLRRFGTSSKSVATQSLYSCVE